MKNLMVFIHPSHGFVDMEERIMAEIQIENSLERGWNPKDIILATNFPYEYQGIKAVELGDDCFFKHHSVTSKILVIVRLFELNLIEDDIYWFHDLDAFQNVDKIQVELGDCVAGFTRYGYWRRWNTGSFFFKKDSRDIFELIKERCYEVSRTLENPDDKSNFTNEEFALDYLIDNNIADIDNRIKDLNITYNFLGTQNGAKRFETIYELTEQPIQVLHFHPIRWGGMFYRLLVGKNPLKVNVMNEKLMAILNKKGIYGAPRYREP